MSRASPNEGFLMSQGELGVIEFRVFRDKADMTSRMAQCPLMTQSGHYLAASYRLPFVCDAVLPAALGPVLG